MVNEEYKQRYCVGDQYYSYRADSKESVGSSEQQSTLASELFDYRTVTTLVVSATLGTISALPFFFTSLSVGEQLLPKRSTETVKQLFNYTFAVCAEITNALFNWNVLYVMLRQDNILNAIKEHLTSLINKDANILVAVVFTAIAITIEALLWLSGFGSIAPFTYEMLIAGGTPLWYVVSACFATVVCTVVYYKGADIFYKLRHHIVTQNISFHLKWLFLSLGSCIFEWQHAIQNCNDKITLCKIKAAFLEQEEKVRIGYMDAENADQRILLENVFGDRELSHKNLIEGCLNLPDNFKLFNPKEKSPYRYALFCVLFSVMAVLGLFQNYASVYYAYIIGEMFGGFYVGVGFAALEAINGIGFTIDGVFGGGLKRTIMECLWLRRPYIKTVSSWYHLRWAVLLIAALSGGSNQTLTRDASIDLGCPDPWPDILGICANIGTAISFNLPQCISITEKVIFLLIAYLHPDEKKGIEFEEAFTTLEDALRYASLEVIHGLCFTNKDEYSVLEEDETENPIRFSDHMEMLTQDNNTSPLIEETENSLLRFFETKNLKITAKDFARIEKLTF
jgi:hypothetical protein